MQGEFCQKMPPWVYGGVQLEGASLLYIKVGDCFFRSGGFRRLRAASDFARGGKVTKTPPGTAPDEHFVLIVAFPRTPIYGGYPLEWAEYFQRAKSE